jgi:hypothetical protein
MIKNQKMTKLPLSNTFLSSPNKAAENGSRNSRNRGRKNIVFDVSSVLDTVCGLVVGPDVMIWLISKSFIVHY